MPRPQRFVPALRFDALTRVYDPIVAVTSREGAFKRRLLDHARIKDGESVLDVACGSGTLAIDIKNERPKAKVSGVDGDGKILARARAKAGEAAVGVDFRYGLSNELPYDARSFDVVVSTLFFHHLTDEAKADTAEEIRRVLRLGGRVLIADWGRPQDPLMRMVFLNVQILDGFGNTASNVAGRLPEFLREAGLKRVSVVDRMRTPLGTIEIVSGIRPTK
ncbi:MAG TPA: methyltransferase domain-containing protein [Thermoleophilaceae bacterium]|nr:methyltransferase domain-containing protein [Thermoleophilaceae bacterium]